MVGFRLLSNFILFSALWLGLFALNEAQAGKNKHDVSAVKIGEKRSDPDGEIEESDSKRLCTEESSTSSCSGLSDDLSTGSLQGDEYYTVVFSYEAYLQLIDKANAGDVGASTEVLLRIQNGHIFDAWDKDIQLENWAYMPQAETDNFYAYFIIAVFKDPMDLYDYPNLITNLQARASAGQAHAQSVLGLAYMHGRGVEKNMNEALKWWTFAAGQNDVIAQRHAGLINFQQGDFVQSYVWWTIAESNGDILSKVYLGINFWHGYGVDQSDQLAVHYWKPAAELGNPVAQTYFGLALWHGRGIEKNEDLALYYWHLAADEGRVSAQANLGNAYWHLNQTEIAIGYWTLAASQGNAAAQTNLGKVAWFNKDYVKAIEWWELAVSQGSESAKANLEYARTFFESSTA